MDFTSKKTRIRKKIPLQERKRAPVACDRCRKQRVKCRGGFPCDKCTTRNIKCEIISKATNLEENESLESQHKHLKTYNCKLERIIQSICPRITLFDLRNNVDIIEKDISQGLLTKDNKTEPVQGILTTQLSSNSDHISSRERSVLKDVTSNMVSTADESFISFIQGPNLRNDRNITNTSGLEMFSTDYQISLSKSISKQQQEINLVPLSMLNEPLAVLPSNEAIFKLLEVFLSICETNFFYIHPQKFREELNKFLIMKNQKNIAYLQGHWNFLVILLGVLSIATCYEYILDGEGIPEEELSNSWEDPGYPYYSRMLPFVGILLNNNNIGSIQVFQLIGVYMTTKKADIISSFIDHGYKYLYLAVEIAISNNLHLKDAFKDKSKDDQEFYKRLWWSCFALEKRLGINLGKSHIINFADISVELPEDVPELRHIDGTSNCLNQKAMIELICIFGKISALVYNQSTRSNDEEAHLSRNIRIISQELDSWKDRLPSICKFESLDPNSNFYRANNHLILFYYLGKIYLGKPFLLYKVENYESILRQINSQESIFIDHLTSVCVDAAFNIFGILSTMKDNNKLGIYSSTDLNFCNLSLFVLIAFLKIDHSPSTKLFLKKGLEILQILSKGSSSARVNLSRFRLLEKKLEEELVEYESFSSKSHSKNYESLSVFPEIDIDLYAQNFQLSRMDTMVLPEAISSNGFNGRNDTINKSKFDGSEEYQMHDEFLFNNFSHDLNWIKNIDVTKFG